MSSETVATAALVTYDIYKAYMKPDADSRRLLHVSHITVIAFGGLTGAVAVGFNHAGFSVNYLITAIGIFVDSAIVPMACAIMWRRQSRAAVILAPLLSSAAAVSAWLLTAYTHSGEVTIRSTSDTLPLVAGNLMSLCGPLVLTPLITLLGPDNFDWTVLQKFSSDRLSRGEVQNSEGALEVVVDEGNTSLPVESEPAMVSVYDDGKSEKRLIVARNKALAISLILCLAFLILWPIPMYGTDFGKKTQPSNKK